MLWNLMESGQEDLKVLQTAILLITTNSVVQHESLAKVVTIGNTRYSISFMQGPLQSLFISL